MKAKIGTKWSNRHSLLLLIIPGLLVGLEIRSYNRRKQDLAGAISRSGTASVVTIVAPEPDGTATGGEIPPRVFVRFHGRVYQAGNVESLPLLQEGKPAQVRYRVGTSGQIYIDLVSPLHAASAR